MTKHRDSIYQVDATLIKHKKFPNQQHIFRVMAPQIANQAEPGSFVHIKCEQEFNLRRPISIMQVDKVKGTIDLLFKVVGAGTKKLAAAKVDDKFNLLGPIGKPFVARYSHKKSLLIGGGVGMPPMIFLAKHLKSLSESEPMVILGSEVPFPFAPTSSDILLPAIPDTINTTMPLLEDLSIACRCASLKNMPGVYQGYVTDLARLWLEGIDDSVRQEVAIYACGPHSMLEAVHNLAKEYNLPCQVSLEEYMACGVGGCAGCVVKVQTEQGTLMKRVCVDGPVFESKEVFH